MTVSPSVRARLYECLSRVFDGAVDSPPDLTGLARGSALFSAVHRLNAAISASRPVDVQADHARLFVTARDGIAAPPYASWFLDARIAGPSTELVRRAYAAQGVESDPDAGEPVDYVSTELEFMFFLCRHEQAASLTSDTAAFDAVLDAQISFVHDHLARWLPSFVARVRAAAPGPVVSAGCDLLEALLRSELERACTVGSNPAATNRVL